MTLSIGTVPVVGSPVHNNPRWTSDGVLVQCARESAECVRLSPITHSRPSGTVTGPNSLPRQGYTRGSAFIAAGSRYGSVTGLPSTVSPVLSWHCTVCPPTAMIRLTMSFSSGGPNPTTDSAFCSHRVAVLGDRIDL